MLKENTLTKHYDGRVREICTEIAVKSMGAEGDTFHSYDAVWDTGAMDSCISPKVATELNLQEYDVTRVRGVGDEIGKVCPVYLMNLKLSNGVIIKGVRMVGIEVGGSDVLIGMNVISRGNFSIFYDKQGDMNMSFELKYKI